MKNVRFYVTGMIIFILLILSNCSKGGGGSSDTGTGTNPPPTGGSDKIISFNPSGIPSDNSVYLEKFSSNNDEVTLVLKVKGGTDVYGAAIEITYDVNKIKYISSARGNYLGDEGGTIFSSELFQGQEGILLIGIARKGNVYVSGVIGDGALATIVLKALTVQTNTPIGFNVTNSKLKSLTGDISSTSWFGGSLNYQ